MGPQDDDERTSDTHDEPERRSSFSAPVSWDPTEFADRPDFSWKPAGPQEQASDVDPEDRPDFSWKPARPAPSTHDEPDSTDPSDSDSQQSIPQSQRAELFESLQGPTVRELAEAKQKRRKLIGTLSGAAVLLVVLLGVIGLVIAQRSGGNDSDTDNSAAAAVPSATGGSATAASGAAAAAGTSAPAGPAPCPAGARNDAGGTGSGPDVVAAFEYAYYVDRSGEKVHELMSPTTQLTADQIQKTGIDTIPPGTTHCVSITPMDPTKYSLVLTERRPGAPEGPVYKMVATTTVFEGKTLILAMQGAS